MNQRTSITTLIFENSFVVEGCDVDLPAGSYQVVTDEELVEGVSFPVYRRIRSYLRLPTSPRNPGISETLSVDPNALDAAHARDRQRVTAPAGHDTISGKPEPRAE